MEDVTILCRYGKEILPYLDAAASLRIKVFRDFPYLYDGSKEYEVSYLTHYAECSDTIFVIAQTASQIVGVSTGLPLSHADLAMQQPWSDAQVDISTLFYLGESCLLPEYRGQGIGHAFFDHREKHARALACRSATFCAVERERHHPLRPEPYRDNHAFWRKRNYQPTECICLLEWQQVDQPMPTQQSLRFWRNDVIA